MRTLFLMAIATLLIVSCSKSSNKPSDSNTKSGLTGTYVRYRMSDTAFINGDRINGVLDVEEKNFKGDTLYGYPGTDKAYTKPNFIVGYNSIAELTDTLIFTSNTNGNERGGISSPTTSFTYSMDTHIYHTVGIEDFYYERIFKLDDSKIRVDITETGTTPQTVEYRGGYYYRKL